MQRLQNPLCLKKVLFFAAAVCGSYCCNPRVADGVRRSDTRKDIEMLTDKGRIVLRLSDKTPGHRNNFLRLVKTHFYDSILFHRVIKGFVVQTGDQRTKPVALQNSDKPPYTIPAEFDPELFHKRGALNAARTGEETNPLQASSGTQFTMIQGKLFTDSLLDVTEKRVTRMNAYKLVLQDPANAWMLDKLKAYAAAKQPDSAKLIRDQIDTLTVRKMNAIPAYHFSAERRRIYKTIGGAPHLDGNYTVFGEVVSGMDVVDSIASVKTQQDRPVQDVRIIQARLIRRK
ncbi:MAG: peptidylprolyl isomerase [Williamsia sp.]|nr:peptidylprolyl isomerase [Williamsia sp.]